MTRRVRGLQLPIFAHDIRNGRTEVAPRLVERCMSGPFPCVDVDVRVRVRACVRARVGVRACVRAFVRACVRVFQAAASAANFGVRLPYAARRDDYDPPRG